MFDIVILGGGISGAAVAREAALAGWRVALVEKGDFASGTSSRSSKLIHGGQRYLESRQFSLVRESCRERAILSRLAPHLVRPLPFLFSVGNPGAPSRPLLALGLQLYRAMALGGGLGPTAYLRAGDDRLRREAPGLAPPRMRGAYRYFDAQADDALLTLAFLRDAARRGAVLLSYTRAESIVRDRSGAACGVGARDVRSGKESSLPARVVIAAIGPWTGAPGPLPGQEHGPRVRLSRGSHFFLPAGRLPVSAAVVLLDSRNRRCYAIPWRGGTLVGTTDEDFGGSPDEVAATAEDRVELCGALGRFFPSAGISESELGSGFAALRALPAGDPGEKPEDVSREEQILEPAARLLAVYGGKLTTARRIAGRILARAERILARDFGLSPRTRRASATTPLPGGNLPAFSDFRERIRARVRDSLGLSPAHADRIIEREGSQAEAAVGRMEADRRLARPLSRALPYTVGDLVWGVESAFARTPEDLLSRRTRLAWESPAEAEEARYAAEEVLSSVPPGWK